MVDAVTKRGGGEASDDATEGERAPLLNGVIGAIPSSLRGIAPLTILLFVLFGLTATWIAPYDPLEQNITMGLQGPSVSHPFGTDQFGRDVLSRVIFGNRISLTVAVAGTGIGLIVGVIMGAIAAMAGGWIDNVLMRTTDVFLAFPYIVLALALAWAIGPSVATIIVVVGVIFTPQFARIARAAVMDVRHTNYVAAAVLVGQPWRRVIWKHVLPNVLPTIVVYGTLLMGTAINIEAALSFLGVGTPPPDASWGSMLSDARTYLRGGWWLILFPGAAIMIVILSFNMFGDMLRDALDPRTIAERRRQTRAEPSEVVGESITNVPGVAPHDASPGFKGFDGEGPS